MVLTMLGCPTTEEPEEEEDDPAVTDYTSPNIGILKYVPAGQFQRDESADNITVISKPFRIGVYEITRQQFFDLMGTDPTTSSHVTGMTDPLCAASWYRAIAFCNKLSLAEGLNTVYTVAGVDFNTLTYADIPSASSADATWDAAEADWTANGYRLPTEMEWLWAAMGAADSMDKAFAGDNGTNSVDDYAWHQGNCDSKTHPVGTKLPNELGLYDMSGNAMEWCWDYFGSYPDGTVTDYHGPVKSLNWRRLKGGDYYDNTSWCAISYRYGIEPYSSDWGFRVVRN